MNNVNNLIEYFKSIGLNVNTTTKARGHLGFYMKNRIDISKNIAPDYLERTLIHEFAHFVHSRLEDNIEKKGGTLAKIFDDDGASDIYRKELISVTNFVDKNSKFEKLLSRKFQLKQQISDCSLKIKRDYPKFQRSKRFVEFDKYIKKSNARYLLKYDRVKLISGFLFKKTSMLTIDNIERDFKDMPPAFCEYIRLKSYTKKQSRISTKINRLKKYYYRPTELFARFIEGLYVDSLAIKNLAPTCYARFFELLNSGYYPYIDKILHL